jgi:hypothetical protein
MKCERKIISFSLTSKPSIKYGIPQMGNRTLTFKVQHREGNDVKSELRQIDV